MSKEGKIKILFWSFVIFLIGAILFSKSKNVDGCEPNWDALCTNSCCPARMQFVKKCWDNYSTLKEVVEQHIISLENADSHHHHHHHLQKVPTTHMTNEGHSTSEAMPMYFQFSTHTIILFKIWETKDPFIYYVSLFFCFGFGVISVMLKVLRLKMEQSFNKISDITMYMDKEPLKNNVIRMILAFIIYSWDYLLMLIVMTFNAGLFAAVILGLSFGFFLFGNVFITSNKCATYNMDVHKRFYADPACCGS